MNISVDNKLVLGVAVGLVVGIGGTLLLGGGESDDSSDGSTRAEAEAPAESETETSIETSTSRTGNQATESAEIGQAATSGGISMTVSDARTELSVTLGAKTITAPQGGSYIFVETTIRNNTTEGIDITCSFPIDAKVVDDTGRTFDPVESLYELAGNPECNASLQPGFDDEMTWVFLIPPDATITSFEFSEVTPSLETLPPAKVALPDL